MPASARIFAAESAQAAAPKTFAALPAVLRAYIVATAIAAVAILGWQTGSARFDSPRLFLAVLITSVLLAATKVRLPLVPSGATVSLSYCTNFAALALFSPFEATFIIAISVWSQCVLNNTGRNAVYRTVFSIANIVVAAAVANATAGLVGGLSIGQDGTALVVPTLAGASVFFFCNTLMLAVAVALQSGKSPSTLWMEQFLWSAPACFAGAVLGMCAAYLIATASTFAAFVAIPVVLFYWGSRTYLGFIERQAAMHMATVEALARAIGARDQTLEATKTVSDTHVRRIQRLAVSLARRAGMNDDEVKGVEVAALLHDIGKLAVPEHILNKPGKLTPEERQLIQTHPAVGAEIIGAVDFGCPVAPLIASHHERWNGEGYPRGLRGDEIPLGSRILGIVDYFDALLADRPYHRARSEAEARLTIKEERGLALDPRLVDMFLAILEQEMPLTGDTAGTERPAPVVEDAPVRDVTPAPLENVIENIARANTEMGFLYELTEAMGSRLSVSDTMAMLASRLQKLVPASSWALFVCDENDGISRCKFATGLDAEWLLQLEVPAGVGALGYLARSGRSVRNAHPAADFRASGLSDRETSLQAMLVCPLRVHERIVGALAAYHITPGYFTEGHESTLEKVAPKAAVVVHDAEVFDKVRTESLTDPLTGLHNSRALLDHVEKEMSKSDRYRAERALLVIDVDRFKQINDRFGHQAGDRALQFIARAIRGSVRSYDFCARQGGDEFIVVLQDCDAAQAIERASELQEAVSGIPFEPAPGVAVTLAISVGHSMYPSDGRSFEALLRSADERMYADKSARKRRSAEGVPIPVSVER
ncbi:MAG TPA: diguanylate cyclase [Vicinamibacterales bacterium]|nr:diguanylate cyclase [Vicinamibacterales bacterium]